MPAGTVVGDGTGRAVSSPVLSLMTGFPRNAMAFRIEILNLPNAADQDIACFCAARLAGEPAGGIGDVPPHPMEPRAVRASITSNLESEIGRARRKDHLASPYMNARLEAN